MSMDYFRQRMMAMMQNRTGANTQGEEQPAKKKEPTKLPKQHNSDWNTVVNDEDRDLFMRIVTVSSQLARNSQPNILQQNRANLKKQVAAQQIKRRMELPIKLSTEIVEEKKSQQEESKPMELINPYIKSPEKKVESEPMEIVNPYIKSPEEKHKSTLPGQAVLGMPSEESKDDKSDDEMEDQSEDQSVSNDRIKAERRHNFVKSSPSAEIYQNLLPNKHFKSIQADNSRVYGGRFTQLGNMYYCSSQQSIMLYDTQDPFNWQLKSEIAAQHISWTVTDMDVDPQEQFLIYSSIDPYIRLVDLETLQRKQEFINLAPEDGEGGHDRGSGIMSVKFSGDAKSIVCGTKAADILLYDMVAGRMQDRVSNAHDDEINSVCFANRQHSNIVFTGSDDTMVKVWDRRALGNHNRPVGVFVGHAEGVTNVASKGDGVYVASNAKDQLLKIWDVRKMVSHDTFRQIRPPQQDPQFDYRWGNKYRFLNRQPKHAQDHSVFTFKGHQVASTLIRCQFSPMATTGQRYVYTGSADGVVHIFDLVTGDTAMTLRKIPSGRPDQSGYGRGGGGNSPCRDISWHPYFPVIASTEFNGNVNLWTMQNVKSDEHQKLQKQQEAQAQKAAEEEDEEDEEDSGQSTIIQDGQGRQYRVPMSMLLRLLQQQNQEDESGEDQNSEPEEQEEEEIKKEDSEDDIYGKDPEAEIKSDKPESGWTNSEGKEDSAEYLDADDGLGLINTMSPRQPIAKLGDQDTLDAGMSEEDDFSSPIQSPLVPIGQHSAEKSAATQNWAETDIVSQSAIVLDDIKVEEVADEAKEFTSAEEKDMAEADTIMQEALQEEVKQDPTEVSKQIMADFESDLINLDAGVEQERERQRIELEKGLITRRQRIEANKASKAKDIVESQAKSEQTREAEAQEAEAQQAANEVIQAVQIEMEAAAALEIELLGKEDLINDLKQDANMQDETNQNENNKQE